MDLLGKKLLILSILHLETISFSSAHRTDNTISYLGDFGTPSNTACSFLFRFFKCHAKTPQSETLLDVWIDYIYRVLIVFDDFLML